jgi:hypothetical protein
MPGARARAMTPSGRGACHMLRPEVAGAR